MARIIQHQSVAKNFAPKASVVGVFTKFSLPVKSGLSAAIIATTFVGFVQPRPAQATKTFTNFSQPQTKTVQSAVWLKTPFNRAKPLPVFTAFSQPQFNKLLLPDEQPSSLFVEPPFSPPFIGFAKFQDFLVVKPKVHLFSNFNANPVFFPPDTHDGGWIKKRKKKPVDALALKLEEQLKRRADIELAVYGPEVSYEIPVPKFEQPASPPNIGNLPQIISLAQHQQYLSAIKQADDDEEDELAMILKDL